MRAAWAAISAARRRPTPSRWRRPTRTGLFRPIIGPGGWLIGDGYSAAADCEGDACNGGNGGFLGGSGGDGANGGTGGHAGFWFGDGGDGGAGADAVYAANGTKTSAAGDGGRGGDGSLFGVGGAGGEGGWDDNTSNFTGGDCREE